MSGGDCGMEALDLLRRVAAEAYGEGDTERREPKQRVSIDEAIRQAEIAGPLTRKRKQQIRARIAEMRLRWDSADGLADWLKANPHWEWYGTLTFRDCQSLEYATRIWLKWLHRINQKIWGRRYRKRPDEGVWGFVAFELQQRGDWHAHFLMAGTNKFDRFEAMKHWESATRTQDDPEGSYARIFLYDPTQGGAGYCAKYVTKEATGQGAWEVFGPWPPERWPLLAALV